MSQCVTSPEVESPKDSCGMTMREMIFVGSKTCLWLSLCCPMVFVVPQLPSCKDHGALLINPI